MDGQVAEIETFKERRSRVSRFFLYDRSWMEWSNRALLTLGLLLPGIGEYLRLTYRVEGHFAYYPGSLVIFLIGLILYAFRLKWLSLAWMLFFCFFYIFLVLLISSNKPLMDIDPAIAAFFKRRNLFLAIAFWTLLVIVLSILSVMEIRNMAFIALFAGIWLVLALWAYFYRWLSLSVLLLFVPLLYLLVSMYS